MKIPAVRGRVFDRHGRVLVDNKLVWVVTVDKNELPKKERPGVLSRLSTLTGGATRPSRAAAQDSTTPCV